MKSMYIGSGDISGLLAGKNTLSFKRLLQRFVSDEKPYYNAKASPIDALRTGAILEDRYLLYLDDSYYSQCTELSKDYDVMRATLDFGKYENDNIVFFQELKTCNFDDFLKLQNADIEFIKKKYKNNYNQVQYQLMCTNLDVAELVFLVVHVYDDEVNYEREILEHDIIKFEVTRDNKAISKIKERVEFFQNLKDSYEKI